MPVRRVLGESCEDEGVKRGTGWSKEQLREACGWCVHMCEGCRGDLDWNGGKKCDETMRERMAYRW